MPELLLKVYPEYDPVYLNSYTSYSVEVMIRMGEHLLGLNDGTVGKA